MFTDTVSPGITYLYYVRAVNGFGTSSAASAIDAATTIIFTEDPVVAGTTVKAVHVTEIRTAVNAFRKSAGLQPASFQDDSLSGATIAGSHSTAARAWPRRERRFPRQHTTPGTKTVKSVPCRNSDV